MIERVITHPAGRFTRCRACGHAPRHIRVDGRSHNETVQFIVCATRHRMECACGARTALHDTLAAAETEWGTDYAQLALPLRTRRGRRVAA